jgi:L-ascorbate metabolism protein UlaG (beta-lactamase superfamily)
VTWIGHSTVVLDLDGARLVTDPVFQNRLGHLTRRGRPVDLDRLSGVDAALVSHVHRDHLDVRSLRALPGAPEIVGPRGAGRVLRRSGRHVTELSPGESAEVAGLTVTATPAQHPSRRAPRFRWIPAVGFLIEGSRRVYFAGDTDVFPGMADLAPLDVALLPVWGWGPSLGPGHLNPRSAAEALRMLRPKVAIPIHWGTFFPAWLGGRRSSLEEPPRRFERHAAELAPGVEVRVLQPGGSAEL